MNLFLSPGGLSETQKDFHNSAPVNATIPVGLSRGAAVVNAARLTPEPGTEVYMFSLHLLGFSPGSPGFLQLSNSKLVAVVE